MKKGVMTLLAILFAVLTACAAFGQAAQQKVELLWWAYPKVLYHGQGSRGV